MGGWVGARDGCAVAPATTVTLLDARYPSAAMLALHQKALVAAIVVAMNLFVFIFFSWLVVIPAIPSALFLAAVFRR